MPDDNQQPGLLERGDSLAHDLRHALYALRTGIDLLPQIRQNVSEFDDIHRLLKKEVENASALAAQLLRERDAGR